MRPERVKRWAGALAAVLVLVGVVATIAQGADVEERRKVFLSAIEYKGGANVADEPFPPEAIEGTRPLAPLGAGYILKAPDETGRWEVESYRFEPGFLMAKLGERLTLEIAGINGALHDISLVSPSGNAQDYVVTRGRLTRIRFRADKAGFWTLVCHTHGPAMRADILVIQ